MVQQINIQHSLLMVFISLSIHSEYFKIPVKKEVVKDVLRLLA